MLEVGYYVFMVLLHLFVPFFPLHVLLVLSLHQLCPFLFYPVPLLLKHFNFIFVTAFLELALHQHIFCLMELVFLDILFLFNFVILIFLGRLFLIFISLARLHWLVLLTRMRGVVVVIVRLLILLLLLRFLLFRLLELRL